MKRGLINRKGLSTIIVTLILIVISLAAIGVFWLIISNVIKGGSEQVGLDRFIVDAEIKNVGTDNVSNNVSLTFKRKAGSGDMTGIKFVFTDGFNTEMFTEEFTLKELEEKRFIFHLTKLYTDNLLTISIVPLIKTADGKEIIGNILGTYSVKKGNYEAGTTTPASCTSTTCSALGYECNSWSNGTCGGTLNCGSCGSGYNCTNGLCVAEGACSPATNPCGSAVCGTAINGTCGTISCGNCLPGYNCTSGACVLQISDCSDTNILCVDDTAGATQEYLTIQACANAVQAGQTCLVYPGIYHERVTFASGHSGTASQKVIIKSQTPRAAVVMQGFNTDNVNYVRIEGFNITNNLTSWDNTQAIFGGHGSHLEIINNYFYNINGTAIDLTWYCSTNNLVQNNTIYGSQVGIFVCNDTLVENNEISRLIWRGTTTVNDADYMRYFGNNITIRNNYFHDTNMAETEFLKFYNGNPVSCTQTSDCTSVISGEVKCAADGWCKGWAHVDCFQTFNTNGFGIKNILIEKNYCRDATQGLLITAATAGSFSSGVIFRNNILTNMSHGVYIYGQYLDNISVYNNVFYQIGLYGVMVRDINGVVIKNNIIHAMNRQYLFDGTNPVRDYNILYGPGSIVGQGTNDIINQDPSFVNPAGRDFHIQSSSIARNAGTNLAGLVDTDREGISRPQEGSWDIGAYEYH